MTTVKCDIMPVGRVYMTNIYNESMVCPCSGAYMRGENGKESLINSRPANCPGFPGTVPNFEPCPGCPGKRLNVPDSRGLNFKRKLTKIVIKLAKIHISKAIFF